jgi:hypothetical protein
MLIYSVTESFSSWATAEFDVGCDRTGQVSKPPLPKKKRKKSSHVTTRFEKVSGKKHLNRENIIT